MRATTVEDKVIGLRSAPRASKRTLRNRFQRANVARDQDLSNYLISVGGGKMKLSDIWLVDSGAIQHMSNSTKFIKKITRSLDRSTFILRMTVRSKPLKKVTLRCQ